MGRPRKISPQMVADYVRERPGGVKQREIMMHFNVSRKTVQLNLDYARLSGLVERRGSDRPGLPGNTYLPPKEPYNGPDLRAKHKDADSAPAGILASVALYRATLADRRSRRDDAVRASD